MLDSHPFITSLMNGCVYFAQKERLASHTAVVRHWQRDAYHFFPRADSVK